MVSPVEQHQRRAGGCSIGCDLPAYLWVSGRDGNRQLFACRRKMSGGIYWPWCRAVMRHKDTHDRAGAETNINTIRTIGVANYFRPVSDQEVAGRLEGPSPQLV